MEPFLRLGLLAVQDDGDGQDVDEQTPGAMSICDDSDESEEDDDFGLASAMIVMVTMVVQGGIKCANRRTGFIESEGSHR